MPAETTVMGLFRDEDRAADSVGALRQSPWSLIRTNSPIPSHKLSDAMQLKTSRVGWFTLCGGIIGFFTGFLFAAFTATRWSLIVSGKPIVALVPFFIVGFEFTILFAVFGNVVGLITQMELPSYGDLARYDERCSGEHFGVVAACPEAQQGELIAFFKAQGAEVRVLETVEAATAASGGAHHH